jgi:6-phosphogluconolactonase (cycloisomerase 2 family)
LALVPGLAQRLSQKKIKRQCAGEHFGWRRFMTMKVRALAISMLMTSAMWLAGCGHYVCTKGFGDTTCSSSGGGGGKNSGGGGTTSGIYLLIADAGGIQGEVVDPTTKTVAITPNFGNVTVNTNVPGDWMVIANGQFMYTAYTSIGQIYGWSLNGDGTLTSLTTLSGGQTQAANYLLNATGGLQYMITNPAGTMLFVADANSNQVHSYQIGSNGSLSEMTPAAQLPSGFNPFNLATDGLGKYLYVSNVASLQTSQVAEFSIGSTGVLTAVGSPVASNLQQMQGESSGKFMIGTSGGIFGSSGNLYVASIDQSTGALTGATQAPTAGQPINLVVQSNAGGNLVYTFDAASDSLNGSMEGFTLDSSTGALTAIPGVNQLGFTGQFDSSGKYLFVASNPNEAHVAMNIFDVSADTTLATPLAGVAWSQGAWAPFDTQ